MSRDDGRVNKGDSRFVWGYVETRIMVAAAGIFGVGLGFVSGWFTRMMVG